jgi:hypothetical protein
MEKSTKEALFLMYINAADPIGVTILGFEAGDLPIEKLVLSLRNIIAHNN